MNYFLGSWHCWRGILTSFAVSLGLNLSLFLSSTWCLFSFALRIFVINHVLNYNKILVVIWCSVHIALKIISVIYVLLLFWFAYLCVNYTWSLLSLPIPNLSNSFFGLLSCYLSDIFVPINNINNAVFIDLIIL
jgi:hypothetical protein